MSSDDEFDDLFSFSSPAKVVTANPPATTEEATADDDDFLDDVFGASGATATGIAASATSDTNASFLDIFDSPAPSDSRKATAAAGSTPMDDIEAEFDLLTADVGISAVEVAGGAPAPSTNANSSSSHTDITPTDACESSDVATQETAGERATVVSTSSSFPTSIDAQDVSTSEKVAPPVEKPPEDAVTTSTSNEVPAPDTASVPNGSVVGQSVLAPLPTPALGPSAQAADGEVPSKASASTLAPAATPADVKSTPSPSSAVVKAPSPVIPAASQSLLHPDDGFHAHDAETQEMLDFLDDDDNKVGGDSPSAAAVRPDLPAAANAQFSVTVANPSEGGDGNDDDDGDFGAFATADSTAAPFSSLSPPGGSIVGSLQQMHSEDQNHTEDDGPAFDFSRDILGVAPSEEEIAEKKAKEEDKKQKAATEAAMNKAAAANTSDDHTARVSEDSDVFEGKMLPGSTIMAGGTSSISSFRNLAIPSKLSNPLRRKPRTDMEVSAQACPESESSAKAMGVARKDGEEKVAKDTDAPQVKSTVSAAARMGSILTSIKSKATTSSGGGESKCDEKAIEADTKQVDVDAGAAVTSSKPKEGVSPPNVPPPPKFESIAEAIRSPHSTASQVRDMFQKEQEETMRGPSWAIADTDRAHLWVKLVTGKTLEDVATCTLVEAFIAWNKSFSLPYLERLLSENDEGTKRVLTDDDDNDDLDLGNLDVVLLENVLSESNQLAKKADCVQYVGGDQVFKRDLCSVIIFYYRSMAMHAAAASTGGRHIYTNAPVDKVKLGPRSNEEEGAPKEKGPSEEYDSHVALVVAVLLTASIPLPIASVLLTRLFSTSLPLMSLSDVSSPTEVDGRDDEAKGSEGTYQEAERFIAARTLHSKMYLLACYHLPLLVTHLDRHCPSWWNPRKVESGTDNTAGAEGEDGASTGRYHHEGYVPMSWFVGHCVGQPGTPNLDISQTILLWDSFLGVVDSSLAFFLALATLEEHSDALLMLQGEELGNELCDLLTFCAKVGKGGNAEGGSKTFGGDDSTNVTNATKVKKWLEMAQLLRQSTPKSVVSDLRAAEDTVVAAALARRRELAEERLKAKAEAEAREHRQAQDEQRKQRQDSAKRALIRTRLTQYYRRQCPEKISSVDRILQVYEGRYDVLDSNLKKKYGVGFLPQMPTITVSPQLSTSTSKLLSSVKDQKARIAQKVESAARKQKKQGDDDTNMEGNGHVYGLGESVCLTVQCNEVIPIVCGRHTPSKDLKYYLIDCRPDSSQNEGKFPTSVSASSLMDPEKLEALESLFESLRGAVHICVMGGGYAALKMLYDHDLTRHEVALATEDDSVTSSCALFFIKRGYPFVSILDGGFAAAHAWLCRNNEALTPSTVLVNYDPKVSTLAQLERAYNASSTERTQMKLQNILDNSMTVLSKSEEAIERRYMTATSAENRQKAKEAISKQSAKLISSLGSRAETKRGDTAAQSIGNMDEADHSSRHSDDDLAPSTTGTFRSTGLTADDEKKDETETEERSKNITATKMKMTLASFSSSVKAKSAITSSGGDSSEESFPMSAATVATESSNTTAAPIPVAPTRSKFHFLVSKPSATLGAGASRSSSESSTISSAIASSTLKKISFGSAKPPSISTRSSFPSASTFNIGSKLKSKIQVNGDSTHKESAATRTEEESIIFSTES